MRDRYSTSEVYCAAAGVLHNSGSTARTQIGAPIDTLGFKDMLAVLTIPGVIAGSGTDLAVGCYAKFQEAGSATGTTTAWADITNGAFTGTCQMTTVSGAVGSAALMSVSTFKVAKMYERLNDGVRKRFIRAVVYASGGAGVNAHIPYSVSVILGRPENTSLYVVNPGTISTNAESTCSCGVLGTAIGT